MEENPNMTVSHCCALSVSQSTIRNVVLFVFESKINRTKRAGVGLYAWKYCGGNIDPFDKEKLTVSFELYKKIYLK